MAKINLSDILQGQERLAAQNKGSSEKIERISKDQLKELTEGNKNTKKMTDALKGVASGIAKMSEDQAEAISNLAGNIKVTNKFQDKLAGIGKFFDSMKGGGFATALLGKLNFGGIFNKKIAERNYIKQQKDLGSQDDNATLKEKFNARNKTASQIAANEAEIAKQTKETGLSESKLKTLMPGLFAERTKLAGDFSKNDLRAKALTNSNDMSEAEVEQAKTNEVQSDLLNKIEENTRPGAAAKPAEEKKESSGGILSGIGNAFKGAGGALSGAAKGLLALAGALWISSKAFANFAEVDWGGMLKGVFAMGALVIAVKALDGAKGGVGALLAMGAALWIVSKAFSNFAELEWDGVMKGIVIIGALGAGLAAMSLLAVPIAITSAALLVFGGAIWILSKAFENVAVSLPAFTDGMQRLADIGGASLIGVAAGIVAIGAAMMVFGAAQMVTALENLVTNFLSLGDDSPVEQLEKIGKAGPGIEKAATGLERLAAAMKEFSKVDEDALDSAVDAAEEIAEAFDNKNITINLGGQAAPAGSAPAAPAGSAPAAGGSAPAGSAPVAGKAAMTNAAPTITTTSESSSGTLKGVTTDQIKAHPNFKKHYDQAIKEGSSPSEAFEDASMEVKSDMVKEQNTKGSKAAVSVAPASKAPVSKQPVSKAPMTNPAPTVTTTSESSSGTLKGVTTDQIKSHPNFKKYFNEAKSFGSTDGEAYEDAAMQVKDDMVKEQNAKGSKAIAPSPNMANKVYNKSSEIAAGDKTQPQQKSSTVVSAPTQINNQTQNAVIKQPVRNQDNSIMSYLKSRFA